MGVHDKWGEEMRIIDADALIADMQERYCKPCKERKEDYNEVRCRACWVDDAIDDVDGFADNAIDAVSVVHGEWMPNPKIGWGETWVCSICGEKTISSIMGYPRYNYCPMCGAKMDGEREGE